MNYQNSQQLTIQQAISRAKKATKQGKIADAVELYNAVLAHQPNHPFAKKALRKLQKGLPQNQSAQAETTQPSQIQIDTLVSLYQSGQMTKTEQVCRKLLQAYPQSLFVMNLLAAALSRQGNFQEAVQAYNRAIQLKPDFVEAHSNLGITLQELGRLEEAEASYRQAISLKPGYAEAHSNLGVTLKDLGRLEEARESFMQALNIKPNFSEAMMNLESTTAAAVPTWHLSMMNDKSRNSAYLEALKLAVDDGSFVLEIGTGSGLLSMMAATCGAGEIITCETSTTIANIATKIIHRNGYGENISVINKKSTELIVGEDLPRKADLVISEVLSSEFVGEGVRSTILDANKRLLKKNGKMIPKSGDIRISLLENNAEILDAVSVGSSHGFDLSEFNSISRRKFNLKLHEKPTLLSNPENAFSINLYDMNEIVKEEKIIKLRANQDGLCLGLIQWLRVQLYKDIEYENNPCDTFSHWQTPIYIFDDPVEVTVGQVLEIRAFLNEDSVHFYHSNSKANNVSN